MSMVVSADKFNMEIPAAVKSKWQKIINIMAGILNVPAGLIMKLVDEDITVYLSSDSLNNPYKPGDKELLADSGLYCETVIKENSMLLVPNALADELWKNNPDVKLNMISYLGFPIRYPDNTPFGTICVLDEKENHYSELYRNLIASFRDTIENDLKLLYSNQSLYQYNVRIKALLTEKEVLLKEVHHRIKNNIASIRNLLALQIKTAASPEVKTALQDSLSRVSSMQILYEKLLISDDYKELSVKVYLTGLIDSILPLFQQDVRIKVDLQIEDINLPTKILFPLGIILNELLTNVMKYAFTGRESGDIKITLTREGEQVILTLQDNGNGMPAGFDPDISKGYGLVLVRMLVNQINGSFRMDNIAGMQSIVKFKISNK